jgi:hypothetical protein
MPSEASSECTPVMCSFIAACSPRSFRGQPGGIEKELSVVRTNLVRILNFWPRRPFMSELSRLQKMVPYALKCTQYFTVSAAILRSLM